MKLAIYLFLMTGSLITGPGIALAQNNKPGKVEWSTAAHIPPAAGAKEQLGLAGVYTGVSNGVLIIAGGSNFADGAMPWQGGRKLHYGDIYVLKKEGVDSLAWVDIEKTRLKLKTAYGASVTLPLGIICAGGETEDAAGSRQAFIMQWDTAKQEVHFTDLPDLPVPVANACMSSIGKRIFLIGGESEGKPSAQCYSLDMNGQSARWEVIPPLPVAMSHAVAVAQSNGKYPCVYVIGGRSGTPSGISNLHGYTFCYDPVLNKWQKLANIGNGRQLINMSAASAVAVDHNCILLIGGDKGDVFHQIETYNSQIARAVSVAEKQHLQDQKLILLNNHKGFSRDVYSYNTLTNVWCKAGKLPFAGQVTTTAVTWDDEIFIPGGEVKPGIRTAAVNRGKLKAQ